MTNLTTAPRPRPEPELSIPDAAQRLWTDATGWISSHSVQILIGCIIGIVIVALLAGAKAVGLYICRTDRGDTHWRTTIGKVFVRTRLWFMVAVAAEIVASYAQAPGFIASTIRFLFVVATALQAAIWVRVLVLAIIEHRAGIDPDHTALGSALGIIRILVTVAIFAIAVILILDNLGVNVTGLVAGLGIGGIAIGLAAQGIFRDLFAALSILFDKPFRRGDTIKFGNSTGRVEVIGVKTTRLRAVEGDRIVISNDKLLDQEIRNLQEIHERRVVLAIPLLYRNDPDDLARLPHELRAIVEAEAKCRFDHAWLSDFTAAAITLELMFHVSSSDGERAAAARHAIILAVLRRLRELDIGFSYPAPPPDEPPHDP